MTQVTPDQTAIAELHIAGFTISYCDDGSAYLAADNRPGEDGVSVRIDHLSAALSSLYLAAQAEQEDTIRKAWQEPVADILAVGPSDDILDALDIPEGDMAARIVDREVSFGDEADCEGCKI